MASIFLFERSEGKDREERPNCGGCGDPYVVDTFVIAESKEAAREKDGPGRCSDCIVDLLMDKEAEVNLDPGPKEYAVYNRTRYCFLGELGDFTETHTFGSKHKVTEFLLQQVEIHGHLQKDGLDHLEVVSISSEQTVTEQAKQAVEQYEDRIDEDTPNEVIAEQAIAETFPDVEQNVEVVE